MWDQPTSSIVMRKVEPQRLQSLALQCAEKLSQFVEANERLVDFRTGSQYAKKGEGAKDGERYDQREGGRFYGDQRRRAMPYMRQPGVPASQQQQQGAGGQPQQQQQQQRRPASAWQAGAPRQQRVSAR